jgi:hypothetical protein
MTTKYFERPCGFYSSDDDYCKFCGEDNCEIGILDPENEDPYSLRERELQEFEISGEYEDLDDEDKEQIVAKMFPCYLHVTSDECIDAIQFYRKMLCGL